MERRTVTLRDEDWRVLYETAVFLTLKRGRHCSLARATKVVFGVLRQQDWFKQNSDALLEALGALSENKEVPHADNPGSGGDRVAVDR
jgi:hypothetical protein